MRCLGEHFGYPLIQALPRSTGHHKRLGMNFRRDAKHQFARRLFFRFAARGLAVGKVVVDGGCETLFKSCDCLAMKTDTVLNSQNPPYKDVVTGLRAGE